MNKNIAANKKSNHFVSQSLKLLNGQLRTGIKIGDYLVYAKKVASGRFDAEINLNIFVRRAEIEQRLLNEAEILKLFSQPLGPAGKLYAKYEPDIETLFGKN